MSAPVDLWPLLFGNANPVEIEIGPGRGEVLLAFAAARPETNFFAIEHGTGATEALRLLSAARGLDNVRVVAGDARCIVRELPAASVAAVHVYFPDPWPKTRHRHRRLFASGELVAAIVDVLVPGGHVFVASDLAWLHRAMHDRLSAAGLIEDRAPGPARALSKFERKYAGAGTWASAFVKPIA